MNLQNVARWEKYRTKKHIILPLNGNQRCRKYDKRNKTKLEHGGVTPATTALRKVSVMVKKCIFLLCSDRLNLSFSARDARGMKTGSTAKECWF